MLSMLSVSIIINVRNNQQKLNLRCVGLGEITV